MQCLRDLAVAVIANPSGTETLAFEAEIGDLVEWVDGPQLRIELQAVDDFNPVREPDMFGTQISMRRRECGDRERAPPRDPGNA